MPWTEISTMDARLCFVTAYLRDDVAMSLLCLRHGISRKTGYKWISRYWPAASSMDTEIRFSNRIGGPHAAAGIQSGVQS